MNARSLVVAVAVGVLSGCTTPVGTSIPATTTQPAVATATQPPAQPAPPPPNPDTVILERTDALSRPPMEVEVGCSETELRMPVAIVKWRRSSAALSTPSQGQRLDVTVYSEGFEHGWYASARMDQGGQFQMQPELRALTQVQDADATQQRTVRAFDITLQRNTAALTPEGMNVMEVRNLEPGVIYQWRMLDRLTAGWVPSQTVTVEAPVCVADMVKER